MSVVLLADTLSGPLAGINRYTRELFTGLQALDEPVRLQCHGQLLDRLPQPAGQAAGLPQRLVAQLAERAKHHPAVYQAGHAWRDHRLARQVARLGPDVVVHGPNYQLPAHTGPSVVTVHDLSVFHHPACHPAYRVGRMRTLIRAALARADLVITDAEFNRRELLDTFQLPPERVMAIPLACDARFHPRPQAAQAATLARLNLPGAGYGLFVGTIEPRKNLGCLLDAWAALPQALRTRHPLVVAGHPGWRSGALHARLRAARDAGWLHYLGPVSDHDLPALYAGASVFCFPSWYEGFGLPVLEAMASGVPVIASPAASLPEVGGEAVAFAPATDPLAWRDTVVRLFHEPAWADSLRARGLARASHFSWQATARLTSAAYATARALHAERHAGGARCRNIR